jgi:hypothetical protein
MLNAIDVPNPFLLFRNSKETLLRIVTLFAAQNTAVSNIAFMQWLSSIRVIPIAFAQYLIIFVAFAQHFIFFISFGNT